MSHVKGTCELGVMEGLGAVVSGVHGPSAIKLSLEEEPELSSMTVSNIG